MQESYRGWATSQKLLKLSTMKTLLILLLTKMTVAVEFAFVAHTKYNKQRRIPGYIIRKFRAVVATLLSPDLL